jgi:hypothetical protein
MRSRIALRLVDRHPMRKGYCSRCREPAAYWEGRHRSSLNREDRLVTNDAVPSGAATHSTRRPKTAGRFFEGGALTIDFGCNYQNLLLANAFPEPDFR